MLRVLVVDDHPLMLTALSAAVRRVGADAHVASASNYDAATAIAANEGPFNLVLLDPGLPGHQGLSALAGFREQFPQYPVVVVSGTADKRSVLEALDLGAMGYIPKTADGTTVMNALNHVLSGGIYVPSDALRHGGGQNFSSVLAEQSTPAAPAPIQERDPASLGLTPRQFDVLQLLLQGMPNKVIARELDLSDTTVKAHISSILRSLGVATRTQAVLAAGRMGLRVSNAAMRAP